MGLANGWVGSLLSSWEEPRPQALSALVEGASGSRSLREVFAELFALGFRPDFVAMMEGDSVHKVAVPTYPFERKHYWITQRKTANT
jgi:acyl transferase domain-containing protein